MQTAAEQYEPAAGWIVPVLGKLNDSLQFMTWSLIYSNVLEVNKVLVSGS